MYISKSFIPILKNNPSEAKIKSHQLMLRVGMIKQSSAGIYSWLPLGFKVMKKIEKTTRTFKLGNKSQEHNLIDSLKIASRKFTKEKTGKKPFTNINLIKI